MSDARKVRVRGPNGNLALLTVPSDAMDQRTFDARVASGEFTIVDEPEADSGRPAVNDPKSDWVDYAESVGVDTDGLTKQDIIDAVES